MEPWFIESQKHTIALTEQWKNATHIRGTGSFTVTQGIPLSKPTLPWLEPATGDGGGGYALAAGGGSIEMPKGSGNLILVLPMLASFPDGTTVECTGDAFVGQVAECGGWVIRVSEADETGGSFELLAYPKVEGYKLTWGAIGPVEDEIPTADDGTP